MFNFAAVFFVGNNTELTKFARAHNEPLREIYCWAHGKMLYLVLLLLLLTLYTDVC